MPPNPPESGSITFLNFWKRGVGGVPRGRGEGGKPFACPLVLVAIPADGIYFFHDDFLREAGIWRLIQKECLQHPSRTMFTGVSFFTDVKKLFLY